MNGLHAHRMWRGGIKRAVMIPDFTHREAGGLASGKFPVQVGAHYLQIQDP